MWRETTKHERNRFIFYQEFHDLLPPWILDFHVHLFDHTVLPPNTKFCCAGHEIEHYDIDDLQEDLAEAYPGHKTYAVCMGVPNRDYNRRANNLLIEAACDRTRFFGLYLLDPNDMDGDLESQILNGGFVGFKPYLNYVRKSNPEDIEITDMIPAEAARIADRLGLIILLHIPRKGRLADPVNQRQIVEMCERYPGARFVLAHIGRAYFLKNVVGNLDALKSLPNLYFDTAMVNHWEILEHLFSTVSPDRILFGTDTPIALAPGISVEINNQYTYVTPVPWELSISDDHRKLVFTSFLYEQLRAVKKASTRLGLSAEFLQGFFFGNGFRLLSQVVSSEREIRL